MKKITGLLGLSILLFSATAMAQSAISPGEEVKQSLCFKWQVKGRFLFGQQISNGDDIRYEFFKDNSFKRTNGKQVQHGTWTYEEDKRRVRLKIRDQEDSFLKELTNDGFELMATEEGNAGGMIILYRKVE